MSDKINPEHYKRLPVEAIEIIESAIEGAPTKVEAYLQGQALKYLLRCWHKEGITDIKKAKWYIDRLVKSYDKSLADIKQGLVKAWTCENGKAKQIYPEPKWTPKVGDWVRIKKPADTQSSACIWVESMNKYDGQVIEVKQLAVAEGILHDNWGFMFEWLEPAKQPIVKQSLTTEPDPGKGYRLLSKDPPEKLLDTDEGLFACGLNGQQWLSVNYSSGEQLPSVYYRRKIDVATLKQSPQPPDGWRWLEVGEVIRKGDMRFKDGLVYVLEPIMIGISCQEQGMPIVRQNRFEVGEKVVECVNNRIGVVKDIEAIGSGKNFLCHVEMQDTKGVIVFSPHQLAPCIEETT